MCQLVSIETGEEIEYGAMLRVRHGVAVNTAWRFEAFVERSDATYLRVSRSGRTGRVHRTLLPREFNCEVRERKSRRQSFADAVRRTVGRVDEHLLAGLTLLPVALMEQDHVREMIFKAFGLG